MKILQLTCHFHPNIGGVETHLNDLVKALVKRKHFVYVLTYRPLTTNASWKMVEYGNGYTVFRVPWLAGFFYSLVHNPLLEFLYLFPGLFVVIPFLLLTKTFDVIHAHGLVAGFVGVFWGKFFGKRVVISTHNLYEFPKSGLYRNFVTWLFKNCDFVLTLSKQSAREVESLGISKEKVCVFTYWVDLQKFKVKSKKLKDRFVVLFVGRLVPEKGINELLQAAEKWDKNITLMIAGGGPMEGVIKDKEQKTKNIKFLGKVEQDKLPEYYNAANVVIVPSTHEEGFGRVILESLGCGTPVIGSNRGAIPEAMDETVGKLIDVTPINISKAVEYFYKHPEELQKRARNARKFAEKKYSDSNVEAIIKSYK